MEKQKGITLKDLTKEEDFPFQLNWIRVENTKTENLHAEFLPFEQKDGKRFKNPVRP
jgi:hypothetical protein